MYMVASYVLTGLILIFSLYFLINNIQGNTAEGLPVEYQTFILLLSFTFISVLPVAVHSSFEMSEVEEPQEEMVEPQEEKQE